MNKNENNNFLAIFGLLFGATAWGLIWYPYRIMAEIGVSGVASSFYTYAIAMAIAALFSLIWQTKDWRDILVLPKIIILMALVAGWTNMSYVLAVIDGEVMRVMLLFYLSPLWTLLLARFWLKEPITKTGLISILIATVGAYIMLAGPFSEMTTRLPIPQNKAEWLALSAGIFFAFGNVLSRKASYVSLRAKSFAVWGGVVVVSLLCVPWVAEAFPSPLFFNAKHWWVMSMIALVLLAVTVFVQFGVTQLSAIRASVLFLFELVVAAVASYYWAHEVMGLNEWVGGSLIIAAALIASLNHQD